MAVKTGDRIMNLADSRIVIVADGAFPHHQVPLTALDEADFIVCCDGAASSLVEYGKEPAVIIGDLDSLESGLAERFRDRLVEDSDQETNDLTKAVQWSVARGAREVIIVGATGKREDHTLGNISLLADYGKLVMVKMLTDTGTIFPVYGDSDSEGSHRQKATGKRQPATSHHSLGKWIIETSPGQNISVISLDSNTRLTASGLEYPVDDLLLDSWWTATLNTATGTRVILTFTPARLIIFLGHK
jgi:thiamine pyrophosphokinase